MNWSLCCFFFFKQKTAYEMRISDWSSDVCSSDLGYTARLDPESIGLGLDVFVDISLTSQSEEALTAFESAVKSFDEILECQLLSGASDYRLRVAARSVADFDRLHRHCLSRLPGVAAMQDRKSVV